MSDPAIVVESLAKRFGKVEALKGVDLEVPPSTVLGLLGPNGAGKTTAVRILTTLMRPDEGRATVLGLDVVEQAEELRHVIGLAGQNAAVDENLTGLENLEMVGRLYHVPAAEAKRRGEEILERFDLSDAAHRVAKTYSGGMRRRLDLGASLVGKPKVLFLDEPTTGLDPEVRARMWSEISWLAGERGITVLLTTHYLEEADQLASRLSIVDRGRVVASGTPDELKRELRGDAIEVELTASHNGTAHAALERVAGVREVVVDGRALRARADDGGRAVPAVLAALESASIGVASVRVSRPSLDDVYLKHTGRTFGAAEAAAGAETDSSEGSR